MLHHHLKTALRNLRKYPIQTLISITGLAVGFTCFALAMLWIVYEMTYDSFHKNAKQMYVVYRPDIFNPTGHSRKTVNPLAAYLKETFPEIAEATPLIPSYPGSKISVEGVESPAFIIRADSSFFSMFDVKILEGNRDFLIPGGHKFAITEEKARQLFGNEDPIGKTINNGAVEICAVVSGMSRHSNYPFDFICAFMDGYINVPSQMWGVSYGENTIIRLVAGVNVKDFETKLNEHDSGEERGGRMELTIRPLSKLRYRDSTVEREVRFQHILIFALSGLLVVLCSLFNYLTLFISRFRIRQKELALRVVCGASGGSLWMMLTVEFLLTLLLAVALGCCLTQVVHEHFLMLSDIQMNLSAILSESLIYIGGVILTSLLAFWFILFIFRRRNLNLSIRRSNKKPFRKISVVVQLVISVGFAFCSVVILKQMYFLHHTADLGFSFQNRGSIPTFGGSSDVLANRLEQLPEVTETIYAAGMRNLLPLSGRSSGPIGFWDDKPDDVEYINLETMNVTPEYVAFYDFRLLAGEMLDDGDSELMVLLNESAVKAFGWHEPVGKQFGNSVLTYTVKGVIKNIYNFAPTVEAKPISYIKRSQNRATSASANPVLGLVLFKYHEGLWESCKEKIEQMLKTEYADLFSYSALFNGSEEYNKFLKSENALMKLLSFVSAICILVCIFGFVSLVWLTCEERRKEIAIRKINGAVSTDILSIFAKEYFLLLVIGAVIAFSAGYFIMQRWLEQYVKRTNIPLWVYLLIIAAMALVIVLCVGWRVYKSSIENPADVVKSE
ncbi:MAG: ABC transporter permease [Bacteroidales bacterium]|nr:ABC transporter permease [Bacteroidales bacterium]